MPCIVGPATAHAGGPVGSDARVFVVIRATTGCGGQRRINGARRFREAEPVDAKPQGTWTVAAVLDWEFAVSGSPLLDIGHFLRYECASRPLAEPHFSNSNAIIDLVHEGKLDEAEKAAREFLERYPQVHDGYDRLGMV